MELLAPAGNKESLHAAVNNGADAVYFGGGAFNARRFADNFHDDGLREAIDYCHTRGVKSYITLNTLILDREMQEALSYAALLSSLGADAVLVQDLGLLSLLKEQLPELPLHASTQLAIHDLAGVQAAKALKVQRVVLARELSLQNIAYIHENCDLGLEVFVHGALCMSASGNCLFSSMVGDRSGNRGTCAQPCRKRISVDGLPGENDYHLSLSDLCMLEHIKALQDSGVCSLKIEGRMKSPDYVAAAVRAYRAALDGKEYRVQGETLQAIFNRGGVHTGYFFGDDTHTDCVATGSKVGITEAEEKRTPVELTLSLFENENAVLSMRGGEKLVKVGGTVPERAQKTPDMERYKEQLQKLGSTPFYASRCVIETDGNSYLPIREINELRRKACENLCAVLCTRREKRAMRLPENAAEKKADDNIRILAKLRDPELIKTALEAGANRVLLEPWQYEAIDTEALMQYRDKLVLSLPACVLEHEEHEKIEKLLSSGCFCGGEANHFSQLTLINSLSERYAGILCNAFNRYTVEALQKSGYTDVILSPELTKAQIRDILLSCDASLFVYGRAPLMQLRHCPRKEHLGCQSCRGDAGELTDEAGRIFPLRNIKQSGSCLLRVLNCETTDILDVAASVSGCKSWLLCFDKESPTEIAERIGAADAAREGKTVAQKGTTRGHWNRPLL